MISVSASVSLFVIDLFCFRDAGPAEPRTLCSSGEAQERRSGEKETRKWKKGRGEQGCAMRVPLRLVLETHSQEAKRSSSQQLFSILLRFFFSAPQSSPQSSQRRTLQSTLWSTLLSYCLFSLLNCRPPACFLPHTPVPVFTSPSALLASLAWRLGCFPCSLIKREQVSTS